MFVFLVFRRDLSMLCQLLTVCRRLTVVNVFITHSHRNQFAKFLDRRLVGIQTNCTLLTSKRLYTFFATVPNVFLERTASCWLLIGRAY